MRVKIIRVIDDYLLNVRTTDELIEDGTFKNEAEAEHAEQLLRERGIYYLNADTYLRRA